MKFGKKINTSKSYVYNFHITTSFGSPFVLRFPGCARRRVQPRFAGRRVSSRRMRAAARALLSSYSTILLLSTGSDLVTCTLWYNYMLCIDKEAKSAIHKLDFEWLSLLEILRSQHLYWSTHTCNTYIKGTNYWTICLLMGWEIFSIFLRCNLSFVTQL